VELEAKAIMDVKLRIQTNLEITNKNMVWRSSEHSDKTLAINENIQLIEIDINDHSFSPYYGISQFMKKIIDLNIVNPSCEKAYNKLISEWKNTHLSSDSVLYSIIRRISRESTKTINMVDAFTQELKKIFSEYYKNEKHLVLHIQNSEWLDRPTLRILYHLSKIIPGNQFSQIWDFSGRINCEYSDNFPYNDIINNLKKARSEIFRKISVDLNVKIINESNKEINWDKMKFKKMSDNLLGNAALALVTLNYEYGYLACIESMSVEDKDYHEVYRILGLIHVNLNFPKLAYQSFLKAIKLTNDISKKAHLEYLCGLLATKRFYDPSLAEYHYKNGLEYLEDQEEDSSTRLEKAWLFNGMSFLDATKGMKKPKEDRKIFFENTLRREIEALEIIKNDKTKGSLYLKFNLYSNIAFLLEIKKDYNYALQFWENMFAKYSYVEKNGETKADALYLYRTGMLTWRKGELPLALIYLESSSQEAKIANQRIFLQLIKYSIGYIQLQNNQDQQAMLSFKEGLEIAKSLNDLELIQQLSLGYLQASINSGDFERSLNNLKDWFIEDNYKVEYLYKSDLEVLNFVSKEELSPPKTKLPSYYPLFDLEARPKVDMNSYLINN
jgi:hypothetical protein